MAKIFHRDCKQEIFTHGIGQVDHFLSVSEHKKIVSLNRVAFGLAPCIDLFKFSVDAMN